ncbi:ABC transporter substrate-binding protein [Tardiphaga robiniae]|uniref:Extracellular solute-binding protein n=1 Tax=Tardiphaga robiniae TaxID=943830 RepID=A0A7G6U1D5_9BRAD|nr:extracellular solute-binding protein [Tardiphaga robiniae]QND72817.1 extracellular solute-binding protein [Tardiphaga robiniae]
MERLKGLGAFALAACLLGGAAHAQQKELRIGYQPNPIQDASIAMMEAWGAKKGVKIIKVPVSYGVYVEKMTASLTSGSDQYDIVWHNDDWGQLWAHLLEPTNDLPGIKYADKWGLDPIIWDNKDGKTTTVPMGHTFGVFFYRKDLVPEDKLPKTWAELVAVSKALQDEKKVKFGFVGAMAANNTWFTWFWSMWTNNCDVFEPIFERSNAVLATNGWKPAVSNPCMKEVVEFWWDAINADKISPRGMPAYDRNEANAVFSAGDSAFTVADSVYWGTFNDPAKSKIAGKVSIAAFPLGPRRTNPFAWNDIWGWSIPKAVPAERKALAKELLSDIMSDEAGQTALWAKTGAPPPNQELWTKIAQTDEFMKLLKKVSLDVPGKVHAAYYFEKWPAAHKAFSDVVIKAVTGKREDIAKSLADGAASITEAAK